MNRDLKFLPWAVALALSLLALSFLASAVSDGKTRAMDEWALRALRNPDNLAETVGPRWLKQVMRDSTALGSAIVLCLLSAAVFGFLVLQKKPGECLLLVMTVGGGFLLNRALKLFFNRPRPSFVPHFDIVDSKSFPSGHALLAAIVYCTLGTLLASVVKDRKTKIYILTLSAGAAFLVGVSRVYLGVHYPTDVLAGWSFGLIWAITCGLIARRWRVSS